MGNAERIQLIDRARKLGLTVKGNASEVEVTGLLEEFYKNNPNKTPPEPETEPEPESKPEDDPEDEQADVHEDDEDEDEDEDDEDDDVVDDDEDPYIPQTDDEVNAMVESGKTGEPWEDILLRMQAKEAGMSVEEALA